MKAHSWTSLQRHDPVGDLFNFFVVSMDIQCRAHMKEFPGTYML